MEGRPREAASQSSNPLVIVADTSAWVEFLRKTDHPVGRTLKELIQDEAELAITEIIVMELLAGAASETQLRELRSRLIAFPLLPLEALGDYEEAALLYRRCCEGGETPRSLSDCLIAVPAIRVQASVLHNDADFDALARHTELTVYEAAR